MPKNVRTALDRVAEDLARVADWMSRQDSGDSDIDETLQRAIDMVDLARGR